MKYFFGWENFKWFVRELTKMYSSEKSFFSKRRIESGIAFIILQWGMIHYLIKKIEGMDMTEMLMWAGIECAICGYMINQIDKTKVKPNDNPTP